MGEGDSLDWGDGSGGEPWVEICLSERICKD